MISELGIIINSKSELQEIFSVNPDYILSKSNLEKEDIQLERPAFVNSEELNYLNSVTKQSEEKPFPGDFDSLPAGDKKEVREKIEPETKSYINPFYMIAGSIALIAGAWYAEQQAVKKKPLKT